MVGAKLAVVSIVFGMFALVVNVVLSDECFDLCLSVVVDFCLEIAKEAIQLDR